MIAGLYGQTGHALSVERDFGVGQVSDGRHVGSNRVVFQAGGVSTCYAIVQCGSFACVYFDHRLGVLQLTPWFFVNPSDMNPTKQSSASVVLFWSGLLLGLVLAVWYACQQVVQGDQLQMIHNGYMGAYHGVWQTVGNTASVVGNVPGSLLAWLVGGPVLIWDSPYAPMGFLLLVRLVGFLLLDNVIRQVFDDRIEVRLIFLALCWLNPWFLFDSLLYNPSYLIFCVGLHLWSAWRLRESPALLPSFLHVLSIGLAMQLHFSWPVLAILSAYLFYRGALKINFFGVLLAVVLIGLSLLPYLQQVLANPDITRNPDPAARERYIGWGGVHVYPVLKAAIYWLRYGSWAFPSQLVNHTEFSWLPFATLQWVSIVSWRVLLGVLAVLTLIISLVANIYAFKRIKPYLRRRVGPVQSAEHWLLLYTFGAWMAAMVSAALAPIVFNYWHLTVIFPIALIPVLFWLVKVFWRGAEKTIWPLWMAVGLMVMINVVALNDSRKFSWQANYAEQVIIYVDQTIRPASPSR